MDDIPGSEIRRLAGAVDATSNRAIDGTVVDPKPRAR
jgi:hypothetical protein